MGLNDHLEFPEGHSAPADKYVCSNCFEDEAIREFISRNATREKCDYCNNSSNNKKISASMQDVVGLIYNSIASEYSDPVDVLPYDNEIGQYIGDVWETGDLLSELGLETKNDELYQDIIDSIESAQWAEIDYFTGAEDEYLSSAWEGFTNKVKRHLRYTFLRPANEVNKSSLVGIQPDEMLDVLASVLKKLSLEMTLAEGTGVYRVRISKDNTVVYGASDLGPPPADKALSGRMNAAGIPVFYGAFDVMTAINETYQPVGTDRKATVGRFVLIRPMVVLDFTTIPTTPSIFDEEKRKERFAIQFIKSFVADICKPVVKDGREHIEYVPTQIVAEYLRHYYRTNDEREINGILYPSTKEPVKKCCALFVDREQCCDDRNSDLTEDSIFNPFRMKSRKQIKDNLYLELESHKIYVVSAGLPDILDPE